MSHSISEAAQRAGTATLTAGPCSLKKGQGNSNARFPERRAEEDAALLADSCRLAQSERDYWLHYAQRRNAQHGARVGTFHRCAATTGNASHEAGFTRSANAIDQHAAGGKVIFPHPNHGQRPHGRKHGLECSRHSPAHAGTRQESR